MTIKTQQLKTYGMQQKQSQEGIVPQGTRKTLNGQLTLHVKQLKKEEQKSSKISRRKEIKKIQTEISEK